MLFMCRAGAGPALLAIAGQKAVGCQPPNLTRGGRPVVDLVRAEIVDVADPQNSGRVLLRAPALGEDWRAWARVLRPNGAANPAVFRQGDVVFIAFEGGDPELPVVLGALAAASVQADEPVDAGNAPLAPVPETDLTLDDLVLAEETRTDFEEIIAWARDRPVLRGKWSFGRRLKPGCRVLFIGPSGTGKTMAAQVIARQLGIPLHQHRPRRRGFKIRRGDREATRRHFHGS